MDEVGSSKMKRLEYFDFARGTMIIWMLIVHISLAFGIIEFRGNQYNLALPFVWLSWFMAPFYVFSGYFFKHGIKLQKTLLTCFKTLLVPYAFFSLFGLFVYETAALISGKGIDWGIMNGWLPTACLRSNTPLWFLISLFFVRVAYSATDQWLPRGNTAIATICLLLACATCGSRQICGYGNILLGYYFYHMGVMLRRHEKVIDRNLILVPVAIAFIVIPFTTHVGLSFVLNLRSPGWVGYMLNIIFSCCGCYLLWFLSKRIRTNSRFFKMFGFVGANSVLLYAYHRPVLNFIIAPLFRKTLPSMPPLLYLIVALILLVGIYIVALPLTRRVPLLLGKQ